MQNRHQHRPGLKLQVLSRPGFITRRKSRMDWLSFLKIMAMEEHAARAKYQLAMDLAEDEDLKAFFERLRDEEAFHAQYLEGEYEKLEKKLAASG
jgi:rubrerythrin